MYESQKIIRVKCINNKFYDGILTVGKTYKTIEGVGYRKEGGTLLTVNCKWDDNSWGHIGFKNRFIEIKNREG